MDDTTQDIQPRKPGRPRKADAPATVEQAPAQETKEYAPKGPHRAVLTHEGWVLPESYAQGVK